jgi:uncharacterized protein
MLTGLDSEQWRELGGNVTFLSQAASYPEHPETVGTIETQMSWVFLTDQHAYKLKKPVQLLALDYSTVELRRQYIAGELAINQALAPTVYLGMLALILPTNSGHVDCWWAESVSL